jgi:hypothetical protein
VHRAVAVALTAALLAGARGASAEPPPRRVKRTRDAELRALMRGPFQSSRLYAMPAADTVGPYVLSISGEGSLLQNPGVLTSAGVLAIGFGDIAQLEYRHTSAIGITGINAPVPTVGVQLKLPFPEAPNIPAFGVAFRFGVPRDERLADGTRVEETVHDVFFIGRLRFAAAAWLTLHGGLRISPSKLDIVEGVLAPRTVKRNLWLPTGAYELQMNRTARIVGEIALAPRFELAPGGEPAIDYGLLGRLGMRWSLLPSVILDGSIGYQLDVTASAPDEGPGAIVAWDIRLGVEVFIPWGALACRAAGVFCEGQRGKR